MEFLSQRTFSMCNDHAPHTLCHKFLALAQCVVREHHDQRPAKHSNRDAIQNTLVFSVGKTHIEFLLRFSNAGLHAILGHFLVKSRFERSEGSAKQLDRL